jgi:hypothetical protein
MIWFYLVLAVGLTYITSQARKQLDQRPIMQIPDFDFLAVGVLILEFLTAYRSICLGEEFGKIYVLFP